MALVAQCVLSNISLCSGILDKLEGRCFFLMLDDEIIWNSRMYFGLEVSYCVRRQLEQVPASAKVTEEVCGVMN